ncbi:MAG: YdcF family protein, partial [Acetobacteraceae bacterium]|nr:YdcF family protein [Acetobacteraceae bacterium]
MTDFAFIISKILWFPARPGHLALLMGAIGLAMIWRGRRFGRWLILVCLAFFFLLIATPISQFILLPLEDRFPRRAEAPARVDGIVVLGGAVDQNITDA